MCEFALFWAQILHAVAANTVGQQACSLHEIRTLEHSLGSDFLRFLLKFTIEKLQGVSAIVCGKNGFFIVFYLK